MKKIFAILSLLALCFTASAQFNSTVPPSVYNALSSNSIALTGGGVYTAVGGGTAPGPSTNIPTSDAIAFPIGNNGFGVTFNASGTNNTTTTNYTVQFQFSGDGINWATNNLLSVTVCTTGTNYNPCFTNIANTVPNVLNCRYARVYSIHHTNTGSIFFTNINISTR